MIRYAWLADFSYNGSSVLVIDGKNIATLWSFGAVSPEPSPYTLVCNDEEVFMARFSTDGQRYSPPATTASRASGMPPTVDSSKL